MSKRGGIFEGDNPFQIIQSWMSEAEVAELNDPNAMALATVDAAGLPNVRMVLLKDIEADAFVFYTNYGSAKAVEVSGSENAAFVLHWKSLRRQIRVRGIVEREDGPQADAYFNSRSLQSRIGAWASDQSAPLESREVLMARVEDIAAQKGEDVKRPEYWGGFRIRPVEIELWADGASRLHDRFQWKRENIASDWCVRRLNP